MRDRLVRGVAASLLGGLFIFVIDLVSFHLMHFAKARWLDLMYQLTLGRSIKTGLDYVLAGVVFSIFAVLLGAFYAKFVLPRPEAGHYLVRGILFGLASWFATMCLGTFFKVEKLTTVAPHTAVTNIISVIGWGLIVGWLMERWDKIYAGASV